MYLILENIYFFNRKGYHLTAKMHIGVNSSSHRNELEFARDVLAGNENMFVCLKYLHASRVEEM